MKRIFLLGICCMISGLACSGYEIKKEIPYYSPKQIESEIQKKRGTLDLLLPEQKKGFATLIFFHGGGLYSGEKEDVQHYLKKNLSIRKDLAIVTPNYRRYQDVTSVNGRRKLYPAFFYDAAAATAWVVKNIEKYGGDPKKIYVGGHSGGAHLALMLALDKRYLRKYGIEDNMLKGCFPISATAQTNRGVCEERYGDGGHFRTDQDSPVFLAAFAKGSLPILLCVEGKAVMQHLVGYREGNMLIYALLKQSAKYPNVKLHVFEDRTHSSVIDPALQTILKEMELLEKGKK